MDDGALSSLIQEVQHLKSMIQGVDERLRRIERTDDLSEALHLSGLACLAAHSDSDKKAAAADRVVGAKLIASDTKLFLEAGECSLEIAKAITRHRLKGCVINTNCRLAYLHLAPNKANRRNDSFYVSGRAVDDQTFGDVFRRTDRQAWDYIENKFRGEEKFKVAVLSPKWVSPFHGPFYGCEESANLAEVLWISADHVVVVVPMTKVVSDVQVAGSNPCPIWESPPPEMTWKRVDLVLVGDHPEFSSDDITQYFVEKDCQLPWRVHYQDDSGEWNVASRE